MIWNTSAIGSRTLAKLYARIDEATYTLSVNVPPNSGPITDPTAKTAAKRPWYIGRCRRGMVYTIITMSPENKPEEPMPAMARPIMKAVEFGADPQTADPISKSTMQVRKTGLAG